MNSMRSKAALAPGGAPAVFDLLIRRFAEEKQYGRMFDARLMQQRHELGLPLLVSGSLDQLSEPLRRRYEDAMRKRRQGRRPTLSFSRRHRSGLAVFPCSR